MKLTEGKYHPVIPVVLPDRRWPNATRTKPPIWCSVDLRDGNQALPHPMPVETKLKMFHLLTGIGFKEIEVAFPAASETEFTFVRQLIEENLIPEDVTIQVLTPAREALIKRTFDSLKGVRRAIVNLYHSISEAQRRIVYRMSKSELVKLAVECARLTHACGQDSESQIHYVYSLESFNISDLDFALEICGAVTEILQPSREKKLILNLASSVEKSFPNLFADQVEWMHQHLPDRDSIILSVHTHNDRGSGVSSAELALLAGAQRVEGTLFGNGERAGNCDVTTMALNMFADGIDPKLDFSDLPHVAEIYQECTGMPIYPRHPYVGELVFCAFSGTHQDAIAKGFKRRQESSEVLWEVPYLPIDPKDVGREYESLIRFTSQSGKGALEYILENNFGIILPKSLLAEFRAYTKKEVEKYGGALSSELIWSLFKEEYLEQFQPITLLKINQIHRIGNQVEIQFRIGAYGQEKDLRGVGVGTLDAFAQGLSAFLKCSIEMLHYEEQALGRGSKVEAIAFVQVSVNAGEPFFGAGIYNDMTFAAMRAFLSAYNRSWKKEQADHFLENTLDKLN